MITNKEIIITGVPNLLSQLNHFDLFTWSIRSNILATDYYIYLLTNIMNFITFLNTVITLNNICFSRYEFAFDVFIKKIKHFKVQNINKL